MNQDLADRVYHKQENVLLLRGESKAVLDLLPAGSVHTCVTSPPYWGLRDYQTAEWRAEVILAVSTRSHRSHAPRGPWASYMAARIPWMRAPASIMIAAIAVGQFALTSRLA